MPILHFRKKMEPKQIVSRNKKGTKNVVLFKDGKITKTGLSRLGAEKTRDTHDIFFEGSHNFVVRRGIVTQEALRILSMEALVNPPITKDTSNTEYVNTYTPDIICGNCCKSTRVCKDKCIKPEYWWQVGVPYEQRSGITVR